MAEKEEYLYRFRFCEDGYSSRPGWGEWEFVDEQKYKEIVAYINWGTPCRYQAQKISVEKGLTENHVFDIAKTDMSFMPVHRMRFCANNEWSEWAAVDTSEIRVAMRRRRYDDCLFDFEVSLDNGESWRTFR